MNKGLIETYRQQLIEVANKLANEVCRDHSPAETCQLVNALLTVHAKVREYDTALFGGEDNGTGELQQ